MGSIHGYLFQAYSIEIKYLSSILIAAFGFFLIFVFFYITSFVPRCHSVISLLGTPGVFSLFSLWAALMRRLWQRAAVLNRIEIRILEGFRRVCPAGTQTSVR